MEFQKVNPYKKYDFMASALVIFTILVNFTLDKKLWRALKDATQCYQENKELKRKTLLLMDKDAAAEGMDADIADDGASNSETELENLNKTIKQLSTEVAELQTEVDYLKREENIKLSENLEEEKLKCRQLETELVKLKKQHHQTLLILQRMKQEIQDLQSIEEGHRTNLVILKNESDAHKRERNVLKHQSALILQGLNENEGGNNYMMLIQEIEDLKRIIEDERNKFEKEIGILQHQDTNTRIEVLEEKLKLVESELQAANERAERAEEKLRAPPIPPPPPPPPMPLLDPPRVPLRRRKSKVALSDLTECNGVQENLSPEKKLPTSRVNEDIIKAIKAGQFTLKKAKNDTEKQDREQPKAVSELLNKLGSLRRAPKKRQSQFFGEVQP